MPATIQDLTKRFGLESVPESVKRLTQMVAKRDADAEDIAKLISQDKGLVARLLRAANPRATCEEDYTATTVEEALQRTGLTSALLFAMSDPLERSVLKTFQTMLAIELKSELPKNVDAFKTEHVLGEVSFAGKATGLVHLRLPLSTIPLIGERMLGLSADDLKDPAVADDVIGELCNMIVGNFKTNICDAGLNCKLSPPSITRTNEFKLHVVDGGTSERLSFRAKELEIIADLSMNPWSA